MKLDKTKKRIIIAAVLLIALLVGINRVANYFSGTRVMDIKTENVRSYTITETTVNDYKTNDIKTIKSVEGSDTKSTSLRLSKEKRYRLDYKGADGYFDGQTIISTAESTVTIRPEISRDKQKQVIKQEAGTYESVIFGAVPDARPLYTLNEGVLLRQGEWYVTTMTYRGDNPEEVGDLLVVGLQKKDGKWTIGFTPSLLVTKKYNTNVPDDVIDKANEYRQLKAFELVNAAKR